MIGTGEESTQAISVGDAHIVRDTPPGGTTARPHHATTLTCRTIRLIKGIGGAALVCRYDAGRAHAVLPRRAIGTHPTRSSCDATI
jgi:hypothetical protein